MVENKFVRSIQEYIYTMDFKFRLAPSFLTVTPNGLLSLRSVFANITTELILMIFRMCITYTYTEECRHLLM